jgi:conjugal transfer/entry exclusion protein
LAETVQRELREFQEQNAALKVTAALVPELRREVESMSDIRTQLREAQLSLQETQARVRNNTTHTRAIEDENQRLHQLNRELDKYWPHPTTHAIIH